ncbi:hypothetical protein SK128_000575 [Halocaridina rubra]|uniref:ascorbate ferrireductase (transmembrane) n=1 Tax=Halocaridina rubra TaxID=373956 RepID=A0AAN8WZF0_HALRR
MTFAFILSMTEALFIFSKNGLASGSLYSTRITMHWLVISLVAVTHGLGYAAIYYNKIVNNKPHFISWHGWIGLAASILFWIQLSLGIFAKYPKLLQRFLEAKKVKASHALYGMLIFLTGMSAMILGLWSTWFATNASLIAFYLALGLCLLLSGTIGLKFIKKHGPVLVKLYFFAIIYCYLK